MEKHIYFLSYLFVIFVCGFIQANYDLLGFDYIFGFLVGCVAIKLLDMSF